MFQPSNLICYAMAEYSDVFYNYLAMLLITCSFLDNVPYTVNPVLSDHIKQDIIRLFRQVVAYC